MSFILLVVFAAGFLSFWRANDLKAEETLDEQPHLRGWGRFYPK
ncbi:MAG TPA: hypothetical protein VKU02_21410 [Gemmataceae bacterium]|nr:hypothetical protein [Gemmataceae bacterium]